MSDEQKEKIWREVIFIGMKPKWWWLALSCGHIATRPRDDGSSFKTVVKAFARGNMMPATAPKRVHCIHCEMGSPPGNVSEACAWVAKIAPIPE